jgi:MraZ protein
MGPEPTRTVLFYSGTFERSLDIKKRVSIPAAWISGEGEEFHVIPHPNDGYLMVMGGEELARWEQRFHDHPSLTPAQKRAAIRAFFGEAHSVITDKQGRILLPQKHCDRATLDGDVVFIGAKSRFEIWSKERYQAAFDADQADYRKVAEEIGL